MINTLSKKVLVKLGQKLKVLSLEKAAFYFTEDKMSFFVNTKGQRIPIQYSLDHLEGILDSQQFFRVNRQYIVNASHIGTMISYSTNRIKLILTPISHKDIIVSKDKMSRFRIWLIS